MEVGSQAVTRQLCFACSGTQVQRLSCCPQSRPQPFPIAHYRKSCKFGNSSVIFYL